MYNLILKEKFFEIVKNHLQEKTPFAFTRYSDGEIMLLNRHEYYEEYNRIVEKLWGYRLEEKELSEVEQNLVTSLRESDVVGFPTERHLKRTDFFSKAKEVFEKHIKSIETCHLTSVDVCYDWLSEGLMKKSQVLYQDYFEELLQEREVLNYISCRDLDEAFKRKYNIKKINKFIIAPEKKFTSGYEGERHYPYQLEKIYDWIGKLDCRGQLCLVGGGVFSKIYNVWFKECGGISLDIGAVFDLWAGKSTRGKTRGVDVEDLTYKL